MKTRVYLKFALVLSLIVDTLSRDLSDDFTLKSCLFGAVKLTKNADPDKYSNLGYGIGLDSHSLFLVPGFD